MNNTPKRDRQGSRTVSDLERRSVQRFSEALGVAEEAKDTVDDIIADYIQGGKIKGEMIDGETLNISDGSTIAGWSIKNVTIEDANGVVYSGTAMYTKRRNTDGTEDSNDANIALTPYGVYLYGKDGDGVPYAIVASWGQIISTARGG